mmetsp:Transcript_12132/g.15995  ORF Transcript_12132/g.15995 Transcript_12132/m.15995 type:complete len:305 (-) Transcript_12132:82-996(-)|eukprot:CAMPEP_0185772674 /NCGR_PEP_ID=MMETSP1174-20130828/70175_1 /TAXON_ID=35687 /ORGANISM="Dictyocha speculum, Strain CCMP1381" /LENGTH=304 /DNA_ID=CAMNT_0028459057 /DNA_START=57 /DNA_END=971 /DNA_ORIENTATION=+
MASIASEGTGAATSSQVEYSIPDQVARFANANAKSDTRYLDIDSVYDGAALSGKRVLVTGAEMGLGLETIKALVAAGATGISAGRTSSADLDAVKEATPEQVQIITGVDVTKPEGMAKMVGEITEPIDMVINNAGYFYGPEETVGVGGEEGHLNFPHQLLQIDVCAVGPLRISSALYKAGLLVRDGQPGKIIIITSQAGSCEWRLTQNPPGGAMNYGHHMSRAACNMMGVLLAQEMKPEGIPVQLLHPGFNRTTMTQKYAHIWDIEGAVEASQGAKRVLYEAMRASMETTGTVINCEDGLRIPW